MDRIEQLMRDARPVVAEPLRPALTDPQAVFGRADAGAEAATIPPGEISMFSDDYAGQPFDRPMDPHHAGSGPRERRWWPRIAVAGLAAAAVAAAVVLAGNLGSPVPAPGPAASSTASNQPTDATPSPSLSPTPTPSSSFPTTGSAECSPSNIFTINSSDPNAPAGEWPVPQSEVIGCAGGWMAYRRLDQGGDTFYSFAKLQNGHFVTDHSVRGMGVMTWGCRQVDSDVGMCGVVVTNQEMDERFAAAGIPVELRPQLVGNQPTGP